MGDKGSTNYIGDLQQWVQKKNKSSQILPVYRTVSKPESPQSGQFCVEVVACSQKATGSGANIKAAKRAAARALLQQLTKLPLESSSQLVVVKGKNKKNKGVKELELREKREKELREEEVVKELKEEVVHGKFVLTKKELYRRCLDLLPTDDEDYVKQLKIFSLNSATTGPKYQVNNVQAQVGHREIVEIFCTWNQFYHSGRGGNRSEAEQEAAKVMLNKVREVCGMSAMSPRSVATKTWTPKAKVQCPQDSSLTAAYLEVMGKGRGVLEPARSLEEVAHRLGGEGPEYSITGVQNLGLTVTVSVTCTWGKLESQGTGSNKRLAETDAATMMLQLLGEMSKGQELPRLEEGLDSSQDSINVTFSSVERQEKEAGVKEEQGEEADDTKYCCFPPGGAAGVTVTRKDFSCLEDEQFLNDVIIDFYLKYLQSGLFAHDATMQERTHIFSIYFYNRLITKPKTKLSVNAPPISPAERRYNNVKKWTKNTNIFEKDFVIVPINDNEHWYVVVICYPGLLAPRVEGDRVQRPVILILDSLEDGVKDEVVRVLREYLACEWRERMVSQGLAEARTFQADVMPHFCPEIPQQPNLTDCGLYLLEYVEAFYRSPIRDFSVPLASLSSWFTPSHVKDKRAAIARLIKGLARDQSPAKTFRFPDLGFGSAEQLVEEVAPSGKQSLQKIKINLKQPTNTAAEGVESEKSDLEEKVQNGETESCSATAVKRAGAGPGGEESPKKARLVS